ncbi:MAG TPA: hypothetical protein VFK96_05495 [Gammaproteobacteria bacterium]|nr:hypothetical protein [Gammaproteobacteria bacterium]
MADEPHIDWERHDDIPVLTDIVNPDEVEVGPYVVIEDADEPAEVPVAPAPRVVYDDNFGVDEAEAAGLAGLPEEAPPSEPAPVGEPVDLDELRTALAAELEQAATRIIEDSVAGIEAQIADRIAARLKDEIGGIVEATLTDFQRQPK